MDGSRVELKIGFPIPPSDFYKGSSESLTVSTPTHEILDLPHKFDQRVMAEDYVRIPPFLHSVDNVRKREWGHGNGEFFHILADQWMELASLQYAFQRQPGEIIETVKRGLNDFVQGLELGHEVIHKKALEFFAAALAVHDLPCANLIASAPEEVLGFRDPDDPLPELARTAFILFSNMETEFQSRLYFLHALLFENPLDKAYYPMKAEMANLYHLLASIQKKDSPTFNKRLLERCQMRVELFNRAAGEDGEVEDIENVEDVDPPSLIDWTALGLIYFAMFRGIAVTVQHVYIPLQILETTLLVPHKPFA